VRPGAEAVSRAFETSSSRGLVAAELRHEFPGLRLHWTALEARPRRRSPPEVERRLRGLSDRYLGAGVIAMRTRPIPHAYRAFFRQVGIDPDSARIPSEEAAVWRLLHGRFGSRGVVQDALLIALVETGVPVWALDARAVDADSLGIRTSSAGERLGGPQGPAMASGRLVVADDRTIHALLFADPVRKHAPGRQTRSLVLFAIAVEGVPSIHVEEALWLCAAVIEPA
jgi:DNA/RNA-binding domain of Phe-tRNA-synthetase-like protein